MGSMMSVIVGVTFVFGLLCLVIAPLIVRIVRPEIVTFPWDEDGDAKEQDQIVILAGSYNPPHRGHLEMLGYLSRR